MFMSVGDRGGRNARAAEVTRREALVAAIDEDEQVVVANAVETSPPA